jgi:Spy/CpxP family protein refolding chaperone
MKYMGNWKTRVITGGSLFLVLALATAGVAQQGTRVVPDDISGNIGVQELIRGLRLTEAQREAIRGILQSHKREILDTREALLSARLALVKEEPKGPSDFGAAQARVAELRQRILSEIKPNLTAEQLAGVQSRQERQAARLERMLARLQKRANN